MIINHYGGDFYLAQILWICIFFYSSRCSSRIFHKWICPIPGNSDPAAVIIYIFMQIKKYRRVYKTKIPVVQKNKSNDKNHCSYFIRTESVILCKYYARSTLPDLKQDVQT